MYKGHMDRAKGGYDRGWEAAVGRAGGPGWRENGDNCTWTTIKKKKKEKNNCLNLAIIVFFGLLLISYLLLLNCIGSEAGKEELSEIIIILLEARGEGEYSSG